MKIPSISLLVILITSFSCNHINNKFEDLDVAQRGCCSWHDGVCGCSGGRTQCCDGTQSPSCECLQDDEMDFSNQGNALACLESH